MTDASAEEQDLVGARLLAFQAQVDRALDEARAIQQDVDRLLAVPDPGVVTVRLDKQGGIETAQVDAEGRRALGAEGLNYAINTAVGRARREADLALLSDKTEFEQRFASLRLEDLRPEALFAPAAPFQKSEIAAGALSQTIWNRARTVGITIDRRGVRSVECDPSWLDMISADALARELTAASAFAFAEIAEQGGAG